MAIRTLTVAEQKECYSFVCAIAQELKSVGGDRVFIERLTTTIAARIVSNGTEVGRIPTEQLSFPIFQSYLLQQRVPEDVLTQGEGEPTENTSFRIYIGEGPRVLQLAVHIRIVGSSCSLSLDSLQEWVKSDLLNEYDVEGLARRDYEALIGLSSGLLLVAAPRSAQLNTVRSLTLALSNALYLGNLTAVTDWQRLSELSASQVVCLETVADDAVTALFQLRAVAPDIAKIHLRGVLCQGVVRKVCTHCGRESLIESRVLESIPQALRPKAGYRYLVGRGCSKCGDTGYRGFSAVQSIVTYDSALETLLVEGRSELDVVRKVYGAGTTPLLEDGLKKAFKGKVTLQALFELTLTVPQAYARRYEELKHSTSEEGEGRLAVDLFGEEEVHRVTPLHGRAAFSGKAIDEVVGVAIPRAAKRARVKPLLLVVEDDRDHRGILQMCFKAAGYDVLEAEDGREAIDLAMKELPDLVITDLMMPKVDGAQLIAKMRADDQLRGVPVLVLTVISDAEKEYQLLDLGADDYCEKTIKRRLLLKRVENLLKRGAHV